LATVLARSSHEVRLWGLKGDGVEAMAKLRENKRFLPGVKLEETVHPLLDMRSALEDAELVVCAVPSHAVRSVLEQAGPYIGAQSCLINAAKGLAMASGKRMSQVFGDVLGEERIKQFYGVLSGPSHAEEVGRNLPTLVTLGAYKHMTAFEIQNYFTAPMFRVYTNPDVAGVEMGGTFKNIVALAAGGADGLGYGDNSIAALITRGLTEMIRFGTALGGESQTFTGLSGLGDMVVTATSEYSRNRKAGGLMVRNMNVDDIRRNVNMEVEGINAAKVVYELARRRNIEMPICKAMYAILYKGGNPAEAVTNLMMRRQKAETGSFF
jgi:glycerol-3-phosphate dehydrogenase (NAD(P)+)